MKKRKSKLRRNEARTAWLFILPSLLGISIFILIPFIDAVRRSFYEAMGGRFVGIDNYKTVIENEAFQLAAGNTGRFIMICLPLLLVLSLLLSVMMSTHKRWGDIFKVSFLIPMAIPVASVAFLWQIFFHNKGLVNHLLISMDKEAIDFMNTNYAFMVLIFSYLWKNLGYDCVLWLSGLSGISFSLYEAAAIDGAGAIKKFYYITLPGLLPTLFVTAILSLVNSFKVFREAYLISGSYPHNSIYMLQHLFNNWFVSLDIQKMCAAAVMLAIAFVILVLLLHNLGKRGVEEE
jgi:multiple sugar transport system permease protein